MGRGGRRRHTTKTGGSAKQLPQQEDDDNDETMLRFDQDDAASSSSSDDDSSTADESVPGILNVEKDTAAASDSDSSSSEDEEEEEDHVGMMPASDDDDDDLDDDEDEIDIRNWGHRKSSYYNGDTADLELGQEEQDAFDEEEAAKEVEASRFQQMTDEDFMLSDTEEPTAERSTKAVKAAAKSSSSYDMRKHLDEKHPELLPLLSHFSHTAAEYHNGTNVAVKAIFESGEEATAESIGINKAGTQFLLTKALLEASASLNVAVYMLLKQSTTATHDEDGDDDDDDDNPMPTHPIVSRLASLNKLLEAMDTISDRSNGALRNQMRMVVKAAATLGHGMQSEDDSSSNSSSERDEAMDETTNNAVAAASDSDSSDSSSDDEASDDDEDKATISQSVLNEARFGLRPGEVSMTASAPRANATVVVDAGDTADDGGKVMKRLASTLNSINQKTSTKQKKAATTMEAEDIDDYVERPYDKRHDDDEDGNDYDPAKSDILFRRPAPRSGGGDDDDGDEINDLDDFYSQAEEASKKRKKAKQDIYGAQPKFPRMDTEVKGERAVSRQILKNRGLVAHKNKINRNPRVKKREKYRRALIQRQGAVRSVRTDEGHRYGGEETGIKSNISRSRKLAK